MDKYVSSMDKYGISSIYPWRYPKISKRYSLDIHKRYPYFSGSLDISGYLRISMAIHGYLSGANSQMHTKSVQAPTEFNQLSHQVFVANKELLHGVISLSPPLPGRMRMGAVPVQKMVIILRTHVYRYIHVHTMYIHECTFLYWFSTFVRVFQHAHIENIKSVANLSNNMVHYKDVSCVFCVSMLVLAISHGAQRSSCIRPCASRSVWSGMLLWLTVIWTCHANLGFAFLHSWSCSFTEWHNRKLRYNCALYLYMLCCEVSVPCTYIVHTRLYLYIHLTWRVVQRAFETRWAPI